MMLALVESAHGRLDLAMDLASEKDAKGNYRLVDGIGSQVASSGRGMRCYLPSLCLIILLVILHHLLYRTIILLLHDVSQQF